ncbi:hypothetical protein OGZ51_12335 [Lactococcus lactis]|uniref:Lipoprotein n=1 Tax=Lactococcus lactis TaxID=1358 RepID=A0A9X4NMD5_9LACT|nr:hypothetical protein [Lactococcus lactis]MDG4984933.1 hypothetical protein [Lactococcus lactis]
MKKLTIFITLSFCLGLFSGCSQSEDIANRKIDSVKAEVISTNHDDQDYFTLIPIVTTTGKTTITNFVPIWNNIDYLSVKYKYQGKIIVQKQMILRLGNIRESPIFGFKRPILVKSQHQSCSILMIINLNLNIV